jgi:hypothetical protein
MPRHAGEVAHGASRRVAPVLLSLRREPFQLNEACVAIRQHAGDGVEQTVVPAGLVGELFHQDAKRFDVEPDVVYLAHAVHIISRQEANRSALAAATRPPSPNFSTIT